MLFYTQGLDVQAVVVGVFGELAGGSVRGDETPRDVTIICVVVLVLFPFVAVISFIIYEVTGLGVAATAAPGCDAVPEWRVRFRVAGGAGTGSRT